MESKTMKFETGSSIDGPYKFGYEQGWHWSKDGGNYNNNRDFFWVHWEINDKNPESVKLHIECPKAEIEPELNSIKQEIVEAFLSARFKNLIEQHGYKYIIGRQIKPEHIKRNKGTQAFRISLTQQQRQSTHHENIEIINAITGEFVREVVGRFTAQLNRHFSS